MLLHKIANRTCSHCPALTNHYVMYAAAAVEKIKCESGDEIWRETRERIRAFAYCENCSQPSMFVLCPLDSYSNASGSLFVNREPHAQIGFLNRLRPCMTL